MLLLLLLAVRAVEYNASTLLQSMDWFTFDSPNGGFVDYVGREEAESRCMAVVEGDSVLLRVDDQEAVVDGRGRKSIRLGSHDRFNNVLLSIRVRHVPVGFGVWPSFWLVGDHWPQDGEIDLIEGLVDGVVTTTLHTAQGCSMPVEANRAWVPGLHGQPALHCSTEAEGQTWNQGCGVQGPAGSLGSELNQAGGGSFLLSLSDTAIQAWFVRGDAPPTDTPQAWGEPYATFPLGKQCPRSRFGPLQLVIDTVVCGDRVRPAGCQSVAAFSPHAYSEAFWAIDRIEALPQPFMVSIGAVQ